MTNENNDLEKDEVDIVTGALVYKEKTVKHIMTGMYHPNILKLRIFIYLYKSNKNGKIISTIISNFSHPRLLHVAAEIFFKL